MHAPLPIPISVAPYAGAWIEIEEESLSDLDKDVAPYAGAWIEILYSANFKPPFIVAPYAGAWIEIMVAKGKRRGAWSLPTRERGLKFYDRMFCIRSNRSLPTRERGLKLLFA